MKDREEIKEEILNRSIGSLISDFEQAADICLENGSFVDAVSCAAGQQNF